MSTCTKPPSVVHAPRQYVDIDVDIDIAIDMDLGADIAVGQVLPQGWSEQGPFSFKSCGYWTLAEDTWLQIADRHKNALVIKVASRLSALP